MSAAVSARVVARLVAGAVVAAVAAVVVAGGISANVVAHRADPVHIAVAPAAADTVLTCAGPLWAFGRDAQRAGSVTAASTARVSASSGNVKRETLPDLAAGKSAGPVRLTAPATGRAQVQAAGAASTSADAADLVGFAATACTPALLQSWLVGGATTTGAADLVLLANPGQVPATVNLTLYGAHGSSQPAAGTDILVPPGRQRIVPLAGLGLGDSAPVVHVQATGAPVRALLQTSTVRVLAPTGLDQQLPVIAADDTQVITGVRITQGPQSDATTILRLLAPGAATTATVSVVGEHGQTGPAREVPLGADVPVEVALDGLAPGTDSVVVTADTPVVGAVWQAEGTAAGDDFAWVSAAPSLDARTAGSLVTVPAGPSPQLALTAAGADATVVVAAPDGTDERRVKVTGGATTVVDVKAGQTVRVSADHAVHAAVTLAGAGALAAFPVWPQDAASAPIVVYP